jgi:hypothetical protein
MYFSRVARGLERQQFPHEGRVATTTPDERGNADPSEDRNLRKVMPRKAG